MAAGANDYRCLASQCVDGHPGVYGSTDGGATWSDTGFGGGVVGILPDLPGFVWGSRDNAGQLAGGDLALAWSVGDDVYYGFIAFNNVGCTAGGVYISRSSDGGTTWGASVRVRANSNTEFHDKEYMAVDNNPGSPFFGRLYMSWTQFRSLWCGGSIIAAVIVLSYSDDGGATWSSPLTVNSSLDRCNQGSIPAVGSNEYTLVWGRS